MKAKLNLDVNTSNEACLTLLLKFVENSKREESSVDIVNKLRRILNCSYDAILPRVDGYNISKLLSKLIFVGLCLLLKNQIEGHLLVLGVEQTINE